MKTAAIYTCDGCGAQATEGGRYFDIPHEKWGHMWSLELEKDMSYRRDLCPLCVEALRDLIDAGNLRCRVVLPPAAATAPPPAPPNDIVGGFCR